MSHSVNDTQTQAIFVFFPFLFITLWLVIGTLLGAMSGWFSLQQRYPRGEEKPLLTLRGKSGSMGFGVHLNGILTLSACQSGLRVGVWRIFGIFQRPFLVPWSEIRAEPKRAIFVPSTKLSFGSPAIGTLTIDTASWQRLAAYASGSTAVALKAEQVSRRAYGAGLLATWAFISIGGGTFFFLASHVLTQPPAPIPVLVCYGFPAVAFGVPQLIRWLRFGR